MCVTEEFLFDIDEDKECWTEEMHVQDFWGKVWDMGMACMQPDEFWDKFWFRVEGWVESDEENELDETCLGSDMDDLGQVADHPAIAPLGVW